MLRIRLDWDYGLPDFDPEKHDPEHNKDKETFAARRKRRMADPEKGINSPAFKEFMKSQGM